MTVLASDTFVRANNTDLGTNWTTVTADGPFSIVSNTATPTVIANDSAERYSGITWPDDQYAQITISALTGGTTGGGVGIGPGVRWASAARTGYRVVVHNGTSNWALARLIAGSYTGLSEVTGSAAVGDVIRLEVTGQNTATRLIAKRAPAATPTVFTTIIDYTDNSGSAINTGSPGITYSGEITTAAASFWAGGDFTPDVTYEQEGYWWRQDNGSETTATFIGAQDSPL